MGLIVVDPTINEKALRRIGKEKRNTNFDTEKKAEMPRPFYDPQQIPPTTVVNLRMDLEEDTPGFITCVNGSGCHLPSCSDLL